MRRRLSALSSFYRHCAAHDLMDRIPTAGVARPVVDPDYTATIGLTREQARALVAAADRDRGPRALRTAALIRLLLHNAVRVDEACAADVADLGADAGHRVLRVMRKGGRRARVPLTPAAALDAYLADRARRAGLTGPRDLDGPLLATPTGGRLRQGHLWELVRRLAREAGVETWNQLSPHSLRHSAITLALDAGASLRDVQDYAGHKGPRTTRRYDHARDSLDRNAAYAVAPTSLSSPSAVGWQGVAGVDGTSIWTPGHDQRQCSFSTAVLCGCNPGRRGTAVQVEGRIEASTGDRRTSQGVTRLPLAAAQPSAAGRFCVDSEPTGRRLAQAVRAGSGWRRLVSSSRKATRRMRPLKEPMTIQ